MRLRLSIVVVALVVLAGCQSPPGAVPPTDAPTTPGPTATREMSTASPRPTATPTPTPTSSPTPTPTPTPEPAVVGEEGGYSHDATLAVNGSDGLNDTELEAVKLRTAARAEYLTGLEFETPPTIEVVNFTEREVHVSPAPRVDLVVEAAFLVGENTSYTAAAQRRSARLGRLDGTAGAIDNETVYFWLHDRYSPTSPRIDTVTLVHEYVHLLKNQHRISARGYFSGASTSDHYSALRGLSEGLSVYYEQRYRDRCGEKWSCIETAGVAENTTAPSTRVDVGLYADLLFAYIAGWEFVSALRERGGTDALDAARRNPPASSEQVIHPEKYPSETPVDVDVESRTAGNWSAITRFHPTVDTIGEAQLYVMLWDNDAIEGPEITHVGDRDVPLNYSHPATAGWGGDSLVGYTNGSAEGYVLKTVWDTDRDARQFRDAYLDLLGEYNATEVRDGVYRIPDGPFADAFRVVRSGDTVVVVNAPTVDALDDVHAPEESG